jgi:ABC-2 type transport system ATP-binding protein
MMLSITGLRKKLGRREILKGIDAELEAGVVGLLGANGAGKTTIIRCLTGIYDLDAGTVAYEGEDIQKSRTYRPNLGYLPQAFGMFRELTVYEMMDYFCALKKVPKEKRPAMIEDCLQKVNLEDRIRSRVSTLSGGMVRRVGIAQSLLGDARVIIMDEPTSGLDPQERARFKNMVARMKGQDKLALISTHIVEDVESLCDRVLVMHEGQVLFNGDCETLAARAQGLVYQVPSRAIPQIKGEYYEAQVTQAGSRVICREPQGFELLEPSLEDGYMAVMKGYA